MESGIRNLEISPNWFYHRVTEETIGKVVRSGGICSKRRIVNLMENNDEILENSYNGNAFISLSKRIDKITSYSSYSNFIADSYALIIENVSAIKTIPIDQYFDVYRNLAKLPIKIRFSYWNDEYQVKDFIPLDKIIGIKIPNKHARYSEYCPSYLENRGIDFFLEQYQEANCNLPFIDVEEKKIIEKEKIKEYILKGG